MLSAFRRYGRMLAILTGHHGIAASSEFGSSLLPLVLARPDGPAFGNLGGVAISPQVE